jgi:hypothetical protein
MARSSVDVSVDTVSIDSNSRGYRGMLERTVFISCGVMTIGQI